MTAVLWKILNWWSTTSSHIEQFSQLQVVDPSRANCSTAQTTVLLSARPQSCKLSKPESDWNCQLFIAARLWNVSLPFHRMLERCPTRMLLNPHRLLPTALHTWQQKDRRLSHTEVSSTHANTAALPAPYAFEPICQLCTGLWWPGTLAPFHELEQYVAHVLYMCII